MKSQLFKIITIVFIFAVLFVFREKLISRFRNIPLALGSFARQIGVAPDINYISGTGSMYPTFPKGKGATSLDRAKEIVGTHKSRHYPGGIFLFGKRYFGYELQRGDIVFFQNDKTREIIVKEEGSDQGNAGFVKRLIGLPGDKIEIRDGFVKINDEVASEPYIAKARSTYGGEFLADCKSLTIPSGFVFVMGDNRKASDDSRFDVGFVAATDIKSVIPVDQQDDLKTNWRDTSTDTKNANKPVFDPQQYLSLLNAKRKEKGVKPLIYQNKLEQSAQKRAQIIITTNDISFEATRSGLTMKKAMDEAGYSNIVWGEVPAMGFYEADELVDNYFQFPDSKKFLLNPEFQETGVAASVGEINGCPVQVVVQHLAGYKPPNYPTNAIENWSALLKNLNEVISSWEKAKKNSGVNQNDLNKLLDLLNQRKNHAQEILTKMQNNQWLTKSEEEMVNNDEKLFQQIKELADKLNKG